MFLSPLLLVRKLITVNLSQCQIGDLGAKCLTKYLSMSSDTDLVTINLKDNDIHDEGASHVPKMLYFIERLHLNLSENPVGVIGTSYSYVIIVLATKVSDFSHIYASFKARLKRRVNCSLSYRYYSIHA